MRWGRGGFGHVKIFCVRFVLTLFECPIDMVPNRQATWTLVLAASYIIIFSSE